MKHRGSSPVTHRSTISTCRYRRTSPITHGIKFEIRVDIFNLLDKVEFTGLNSTVNFRSLTDRTITNLPYDAAGNLTQRNGFGTINGTGIPRTIQLVTRMTF